MFDKLLFNKAIELWQQKLYAEATNNIKLRTRLLRKYPELFLAQTAKEIQNIVKMLSALNEVH